MTATAKPKGVLFTGAMVRALLAGTKTQTRRLITRANSLVDGAPCPKDLWSKLDFASPTAYVDKGPSPAGNLGPYLHVPHCDGETVHRVYPRTQVGDQWYVKETFTVDDAGEQGPVIFYRATDHKSLGEPWKPSIFMPAEASRIHLEVTQVRVQRLQEITEDDAIAEGCLPEVEIPCEWWEGYRRDMKDKWGNMVHQMIFREAAEPAPEWMEFPRIRKGSRGFDMTAKAKYQLLWDSINKAVPWASNPWCFPYSLKRIE